MEALLNHKKDEFPKLEEEQKTEVLGRLKMLEDLSNLVTNYRESYTRLLLVNNVEPTFENTSKDSDLPPLDKIPEIVDEVKTI
tara:strand:+ start:403 stop:651 length:249 start_codon:yes stop_codon:yes gene_type:complete